jgi:invasion protein IalB
MLSRVMFIRLIALAGLLTLPAASVQAELPALIYSPWTKFCLNETCFIGKDVRTECASVFAAVLIENAKDPKKILRVTLPTSVNTERRVRIIIDQGPPIERPYIQCFANGCMADYEAGTELVDQFKQGQTLTIEAVDANNLQISRNLPLAGFAVAYDGPGQAPRVFEESRGALEREQKKRAEEADKPPEEAHKPRCESK